MSFNIDQAVRERITEIAKSRNESITKITGRAGVNQSTISQFMVGETQTLRVNTLYNFCLGCEMSLSEFFNFDSDVTIVNEDKKSPAGTNNEIINDILNSLNIIQDVMTINEASERWNISFETIKSKFKARKTEQIAIWEKYGLVKKSGKSWLLTKQFMELNFGEEPQ